ncbi:conserved exported hypothetical protein [Crenothrix polyspora]|uniref:DUF3570 domain-containing protein n=1 Tax=Crenothrix polyspora TaxID=360316 RepID=A0A1R4H3G4_9GAMM|nr:conserved exported hypothetical protein [Crenothrix polyspora]
MWVSNQEKSSFVACLSVAALALPGLMQTAQAGRVEESYNADFQYGHYSESSSRIDVNTYEAALSAPIGKSMTGSVALVKDVVAGASPKNNALVNGEIKQVISGASQKALTSECGKSICDSRDGIAPSITYFFDSGSVNLNGGFSRENDYTSRYVGTAFSKDFNKKLTMANFSASVAFDEIDPTDRPALKGSKTTQQYLLGFSQVINKDSLMLSNVTFAYSSGYLSDPYKMVNFYDGGLYVDSRPDTRPRDKFQFAWLTQYIRHFGDFNDAALHVDYRFSTDSWGVNAHTAEISWHQPVGDGWQIIPRVRYYSQDQADFYQAVGNGDALQKGVYSSDYRLAGFGAVTAGIHVSKEIVGLTPLTHLKFQLGGEYYNHSAGLQLGGNNASNFADFNYFLITGSFNLKF